MLIHTGFKLVGFASPSKLIISCAGIIGGGIVLSITTSEVLNKQISSAFSSAYKSFVGLFQQSNQKKLENSQNNFFQSFGKQIKDFFEIVKKYFEPIFDIFKTPRTSLEALFKNLKQQQNGDSQSSSSPEITFDSKSLWNGFWTLLGFRYRDIFEVEFGAVLYFLFNALLDLKKWNFLWNGENNKNLLQSWINLENWKKAFTKDDQFDKRLKGFLFLLWNINKLGEFEKTNSKSNQSPKPKRTLSRRNMLAWTYSSPWVTDSIFQEQKEKK
ncbi:hypothetical protein PRV_00540 [Mycoplasma parvum str. Indiana]|uniref:Uncharacterized protein n=2 Tax=Mycoplasma parvum TaxID=984991 RepID=U5NBW3_9MOLU|nr:hypothetical protein PRV_00540 [Mycoplasma parvum str. Indiana]